MYFSYICNKDEMNSNILWNKMNNNENNEIVLYYNKYCVLKPTQIDLKFWINDNPINNIEIKLEPIFLNVSQSQYYILVTSFQYLNYISRI